MCRSKNFVYSSVSEFKPEVEIQNLLRNLNCYDICLKVLQVSLCLSLSMKFFILLVSCFIWGGDLDSSDLLYYTI